MEIIILVKIIFIHITPYRSHLLPNIVVFLRTFMYNIHSMNARFCDSLRRSNQKTIAFGTPGTGNAWYLMMRLLNRIHHAEYLRRLGGRLGQLDLFREHSLVSGLRTFHFIGYGWFIAKPFLIINKAQITIFIRRIRVSLDCFDILLRDILICSFRLFIILQFFQLHCNIRPIRAGIDVIDEMIKRSTPIRIILISSTLHDVLHDTLHVQRTR
mmetsp:Transcript_11403/g.17139  ORF Transcript_11403/g.17139 Transcript_11403/m.17139 type:complete len:213 (-) Transcript_11403:1138-1776(-)